MLTFRATKYKILLLLYLYCASICPLGLGLEQLLNFFIVLRAFAAS